MISGDEQQIYYIAFSKGYATALEEISKRTCESCKHKVFGVGVAKDKYCHRLQMRITDDWFCGDWGE